jgi:hypothetical protein
MRLIILLIVTVSSLIAYPVEASELEPHLIMTHEADLTGDGRIETLQLYGVLFSPDSVYYRDIYAVIQSEDEEWRINYQGGYDPIIELVDLNHDGVVDVFYQSPTGGSGGIYTSQLDTIYGGELTNISLPDQPYVTGSFIDGFQAVLEISPHKEPIKINVENRKDDYMRLNIYSEEGKLLHETSLMVDPIAFYEPVEISERQGYGLRSFKQISGAYHADRLGVIETLWYYEQGKWIALGTEWIESGEYDASKFY